VRTLLITTLAVLAAGCPGRLDDPQRFEDGGGGTDAGGNPCSGIDVPVDVFQNTCGTVGCHNAASKAAELDLVSPAVASRLIGVPSSTCPGLTLVSGVDAGFLFEKLEGHPTCGSPMPLGKTTLTSDQISCISVWLSQQSDGGF
jgi:hypothetical protein